MVSMWWVVAAFLLGGSAGTMVFALLAMASREDEQAASAEASVARDGLGRVGLEPTWIAK